MARAWIAIVVAITASGNAAADTAETTVSARPLHWGLGAGGYLSVTGSDDRDRGSLTGAELYPGGRLGRLGVRLEALGLGQVIANAFLAGIAFEAAAARPRLQLALVATAGVDTSGAPLIRGAIQSQLWVLGPIALAGDGGALLRIEGTDTELLLTTGLLVRLAR